MKVKKIVWVVWTCTDKKPLKEKQQNFISAIASLELWQRGNLQTIYKEWDQLKVTLEYRKLNKNKTTQIKIFANVQTVTLKFPIICLAQLIYKEKKTFLINKKVRNFKIFSLKCRSFN